MTSDPVLRITAMHRMLKIFTDDFFGNDEYIYSEL